MSLLHVAVSAAASRDADATAVVRGADRITYGELDVESTRMAHALRSRGVAPGDRVCLLTPKTPRAIVAILGVLKAGAIYVPLDPESPAPRLASMLASCDTRWLLATRRSMSALKEILSTTDQDPPMVGWLDGGSADGLPTLFEWDEVLAQPDSPVDAGSDEHRPAYILFTSGSTGIPKGVPVTHANVQAYLAWAIPYFQLGPGDRISGHPPLHFDLSVFDIFGALTSLAELHLIPPELNLQPARIVALIQERALTQWFSVPALYNLVAKFDLLAGRSFPALRRALWCGEVLPTATLRYWMRHLPDVRFTNLYGPTETTIASSYYTVPSLPASDAEPIPIGTACDGEELLILNDQLRSVPPREIGNLYIAGAGLSPGYWRDPEKTAAAFIPDPRPERAPARIYRTGDLARLGTDGLVYFVGRADTQIKSRGYRIELGEIEAALSADDRLRESAVVAIETGGFDGVAICCAYAPLPTLAVTAADVRSALAKRVPSYMLPSRWEVVDALPRNANGKVDRSAVRALFGTRQ